MIVFPHENLKVIELIIQDYNLRVTKLSILHLKSLSNTGERVIQPNVLLNLEKLQRIFIESFFIAVFTIYTIKFFSGSTTAGTNFKRSKTKLEFINLIQEEKLKKTKYFHSKRSKKVKKDFLKVIIDNRFGDSNLADN